MSDSWTLITPPSADVLSTAAPLLPGPVVAFTQDDLLALLGQLLPEHYVEPLKDPGPGYELLQAYAALGARLSLAVERFASAAFILSSEGGVYATGEVEFYRDAPHPDSISVTLLVGTSVKSSRGGRRFFTTESVTFGPADLGPFLVPVQAEVAGYEFNETGTVLAADGDALEGEIDTIDSMVQVCPGQPLPNAGAGSLQFGAPAGDLQLVTGMATGSASPDSVNRFITFAGAANAANNGNKLILEYVDPTSVYVRNPGGAAEGPTGGVTWQEYSADADVGDLTIQVRQPASVTGGADAALDVHGRDRNILRAQGELDAAYRGRLRALPDNISPNAVDRSLQQLLFPVGGGYQFIETWEITYMTCWDGPPDPIPGSGYDPNLCAYDDPDTDATPFRNRWMDLNEMRGAFVVVVPNLVPIEDTGLIWNELIASPPDAEPNDYRSLLGQRAVCAWDVPADLAFGYLQGAWDGADLPKQAIYKTTYDTLQNIKAAGTVAAVELLGE